MKINTLAILIFLGCVGCKQQDGGPFLAVKSEPLAELTDKRLKEASGLAASIQNPEMFWTHNDSGNEADIYLIDKNVDIKMTVSLVNGQNRDWEDIVLGPGPDSTKTYIYVGDIGDNDAVHAYKYIYRFPEPVFTNDDQIDIMEFDTIVFRLEDGMKDTESLFIDDETKNLYVVSKREEPVSLYQLKYPQISGDTLTASKVLVLPFTEIVSAERFEKNGDILMKNYSTIYYWKNINSGDIVSLLTSHPAEIPFEEPSGEAITWAPDGGGFYTISEKKKKKPSYLFFHTFN